MSLVQFLRILAARWAIVAGALAACVIAAIVALGIVQPRYDGKARVNLDVVKPDPVTGQVLASNFLRNYVSTQAELVRDQDTAGIVVDKLGWATDPRRVAAANATGTASTDDIRRGLAQGIIDRTKADMIENSNIMEITFSAPDPEQARQIADLLRSTYIDQSLKTRRDNAAKTAAWYNDQANRAQQALVAAEAARTQFARQNGIVLGQDNVDIETQRLAALSSAPAAAAAAPRPVATASPALDQIDQQIAQAATTLGPNNPQFQALQRQRAALAASVARENAAAGGAPASGEQAFRVQKSRVIGERAKIDQLSQMQRDIDLKRDQYQKAAQHAADLRLESDIGSTEVTPLGDAFASDTPTFPRKGMILGAAIAFGLGLGVVAALLLELLNRRVRSDDDLGHAVDAPVLAVVGATRDPNGVFARVLAFFERRRSSSTDAATANG